MTPTKKLIGALLIGAVAGAVVGILCAPDKGSKTRRKLMSDINNLTGDLKDKASALMDTIREKKQELRDLAGQKMGRPSNL